MKDDIRVQHIFKTIYDVTGVTRGQITGRSKRQSVVFARFILAVELRAGTRNTKSEIARIMNRSERYVTYCIARYYIEQRYSHRFRQYALAVLEGLRINE